jgi:hypothetical protein
MLSPDSAQQNLGSNEALGNAVFRMPDQAHRVDGALKFGPKK